MCPDLSRRHFLASSLAGSGYLLGLGRSVEAESAVRSSGGPLLSNRGQTRIYTAFIASQDPKWPCPDIDHEGEAGKFRRQLDGLTRLWRQRDRSWPFEIEFDGGDIIRTDEELERLGRKTSDYDGLLIFSLSIPDNGLTGKSLDLQPPKIYYFDSPSTAGFISAARAIRQGAQADMVHSSDLSEIEPQVRAVDALRKLRQTKILYLENNKRSKSENYNPDKMRQKFGITLELMNFDRINQLMSSANETEAKELADDFIKKAVRTVEPSQQEVIEAHKFYIAVRQMLEEESATVMTIDCLPGFYSGRLKAYPCVSWTRLLDDGYMGVCEADLQSTLMSLVMQYFTGGQPGFVSDPFFDTAENTITYAHCVAATRMNGPSGKSLPYIIRSHMEDNKGVSVQVKMPVGQVLTSVQILDVETVAYHTARVIDNSDSPRGCRTKPVCRLIDPETEEEIAAERLLYAWMSGWHRVSYFGNHSRNLAKMCRLMGLKLVREA